MSFRRKFVNGNFAFTLYRQILNFNYVGQDIKILISSKVPQGYSDPHNPHES